MDPATATADALTQRVKAVACVLPLHDLEARKGQQGTDYSDYQVLELALQAIDSVTLQMDFDSGARNSDVINELARLAAVQAPHRSARDHQRVATYVLSGLINVGSLDRGFSVTYGHASEDGYQRRTYDFKLLAEVVDEAGEVYLRATTEAVNVLIGAMDIDIASEQEAAELKLEHLLRSGRLDRAKSEATRARHLTIMFAEQVREALIAARRDVRTVDWIGAVPKLLHGALDHVNARVSAENTLADHVMVVLETANDIAGRREAGDLLAIVRDCRDRHAELQGHLLAAGASFRAEQDRQVMTGSLARSGLDLYRDLLEPAVVARLADVAEPLADFFAACAGPPFLRALRLADFVPELLRPVQERTQLGEAIEEPDLMDAALPPRFTGEQIAAARSLLDLDVDEPARLSEVLQRARARGTDLTRLVALMSGLAYATDVEVALREGEDRLLLAFDDGQLLDDPDLGGADLLLATAELAWDTAR